MQEMSDFAAANASVFSLPIENESRVENFEDLYFFRGSSSEINAHTTNQVAVEPPRKKTKRGRQERPSAAEKERERLRVFNNALVTLQSVIPVRLPKGKKLHKKQTIQFAVQYIHFLRDCIDGKRDYSERHRFMWREGTPHGDVMDAIEAAASAAAEQSKKDTIV